MSSSVHTDNAGKGILILSEGLTQGLDDTTLTAEAQYSIIFLRSNRNALSWEQHLNVTNIYQFKAKDSEIKKHPLCLGNISGDFLA